MKVDSQLHSPTICLVTPFAGADDCTPVRRQPAQWARNRARRLADWLRWRVQGRWDFHYSTYEDHRNSNRGDMAIRIASRRLLERTFNDHVEIVEAGWDDLDSGFLDQARENVQLVVIAGGGYLFLDRDGRLPARVSRHLSLLQALSCPVVGLCLGMNHLLGADGAVGSQVAASSRELARGLIARLAEVSVRDAGAANALRGLDDGRTVVLPDPALFLDPAPSAAMPRRASSDELWLGVNLAFHGKETTPLCARQFPVVAAVLRRFAQTRRCKFFYFIHYDTERLIPRLFAQQGIPMTVVDRPPQEMVSWYRLLDAHLSGMLHSSILACAAEVPALNLAYDVKCLGFYELMGLEPWVMPAVSLDAGELVDRLNAMLERRIELHCAIRRRKQELRASLQEFLDRIPPLVRT